MKEGLEKDSKKLDNSSTKDGETNSEIGKKKGKEERPPTKVVVRRLPPTMTEEEFLQQVEPLPAIDYMYYVPADTSLSPNSFCRAYLNFVNQSDIFIFTQKFDGYVFVDSKGLEYPAIVEFAPFQRIPKQRPGRKKDPKAGTLESDPTYLSFLEKLNAQNQENTSAGSNIKQHFFETSVNLNEGNKVSTTPLLDYLRTRHAERLRAREEKRKKDLERKRARDEQRRNAKKSEDEPAVLKVLPSQTNSNKDKFKEKDVVKPLKKRSDDRVKETKGRVGRSYAEERQKQLEKREEQRKKYGSSSSLGNKSGKLTKVSSEPKSNEPISGAEKNQDSESKKFENEPKIPDTDTKKDSFNDKRSYQQKDSQRHYEYNRKDDEAKRRSRESDRLNKTKEQYNDRREDRYNVRKKVTGDNKKNYGKYDDSYKYKKEHYSSRKDGPNQSGSDKRFENDSKNEKVVSSVTKSAGDVKKEAISESKQKESNLESTVKLDTTVAKENCSESTKSSENNLALDLDFKKELMNSGETEVATGQSNDSSQKSEDSKFQPKTSPDLSEKKLLVSNEEKTECTIEGKCIEGTSQQSLSESLSVTLENSGENDSEKCSILKDEEGISTNNIESSMNETDAASLAEEKLEKTKISSSSETERSNENDVDSDTRNEKLEEVVIKRRNSLETYDRKSESIEKNNRRESGRRSSLESGDQHTNFRLVEQDKCEKKKADGDSSDLKPKDPRTERRIRNKDRPSMEIYRPGMGRFSKQRLEREKVLGSSTEVDSNSPSPSPTLVPKHKSSLVNNNNNNNN